MLKIPCAEKQPVQFAGVEYIRVGRKLFGLSDQEMTKASRLIQNTIAAGLIKAVDPETAPRYKKYIPYWA